MIDASARLDDYRAHRLGLAASIDAGGLLLVLDAANGSGSAVGRAILEATGARVDVIHAEPDGVNINVDSGATAPASLAAAVLTAGADAGFALDGDADRLIAVDANGRVVDGDQVLGILALDRLSRDDLPGGGLVVSVPRTAGSRGWSRRPAARSSGRPSATSTSSRGCRCRAPSSAARRAAT